MLVHLIIFCLGGPGFTIINLCPPHSIMSKGHLDGYEVACEQNLNLHFRETRLTSPKHPSSTIWQKLERSSYLTSRCISTRMGGPRGQKKKSNENISTSTNPPRFSKQIKFNGKREHIKKRSFLRREIG